MLGGGLAGMATAYELGKLGYECRILEGRMRPGGRCHTIRRGTASEEDGSTEVAAFDEGLYYNPGPMRIPHTHSTTLDYCRELGCRSRSSSTTTKRRSCTRQRAGRSPASGCASAKSRADMGGYAAELLSKAISTPRARRAAERRRSRRAASNTCAAPARSTSKSTYKGSRAAAT